MHASLVSLVIMCIHSLARLLLFLILISLSPSLSLCLSFYRLSELHGVQLTYTHQLGSPLKPSQARGSSRIAALQLWFAMLGMSAFFAVKNLITQISNRHSCLAHHLSRAWRRGRDAPQAVRRKCVLPGTMSTSHLTFFAGRVKLFSRALLH